MAPSCGNMSSAVSRALPCIALSEARWDEDDYGEDYGGGGCGGDLGCGVGGVYDGGDAGAGGGTGGAQLDLTFILGLFVVYWPLVMGQSVLCTVYSVMYVQFLVCFFEKHDWQGPNKSEV